MSAEQLDERIDAFSAKHGIDNLDTPESEAQTPLVEAFEDLIPAIYEKYTGLGDAPSKKPEIEVRLRSGEKGRSDLSVRVEGGDTPKLVQVIETSPDDDEVVVLASMKDTDEHGLVFENYGNDPASLAEKIRFAMIDAQENGRL